MKFGKEYGAQMVPEWQEAYMDYKSLKEVLKGILRLKQRRRFSSPDPATSQEKLTSNVPYDRAFSGLTSRDTASQRKTEEEVILVSSVQEEGSEGQYQTMFLMASEEGGEGELVFFQRLDKEFNKVVSFYRKKVEDLMEEADELSKQMNALIALRIKVEKPFTFFNEVDMVTLANKPGESKSFRRVASTMDSIAEGETNNEQSSNDETSGDGNEISFGEKKADSQKNHPHFTKPAPLDLEILDHMKINIAPETPLSMLKGILKNSKSHSSPGREELRKSEEKMKQAFVAFYQKLRLLKNYSFLNQLAFSKIMKKYDKVTSRNASKAYLEMVDKSYLSTSDEVNKLIERVESAFVKHFENGNRRKGMTALRPVRTREKHRTTFFFGLLVGCSVALAVAIGLFIHARDIFKSTGRDRYMETIFPLYSLYGYIVLHMVTYSGNIYFWNRYRVNYPFIFGFKEGTELGYRDVLLFSSGIAVLTLAGVLSNLDMEMDPSTKSFTALTELVPLGLLIVLFLIAFCPFNILYRSSRYFFIRSAFHCLCAPLYKVTLPDFFLADQLTSQVQALRSLEFYVCYYLWGDFKTRSNKCYESDVFDTLYVVVAVIPYWSRFLQCVRRLVEEKDSAHTLNSLKYLSTIIAVSLRTVYDLNGGTTLLILATISSAIATIYSTYWDLVRDWGLLNRNSKNPWLRDKLLISKRSVYFVAMVLNVVLRLAWMQTVLGIREAPFLHRKALLALVAGLEIVRRGIWNFFRLENEHLNNVGRYRAFKSVPLPFNYEEDDEDKDE